MSQNVITPLLTDARLVMPQASKIAFPSVAGMAGRAFQGVKNIPTALRNSARAGAAEFGAASAASKLAPTTDAAAAATAAKKYAPPAAAPAAPTAGAPGAPGASAAPAAPGSLSNTLSNLTGHRAGMLGASAMALKGWVDPGTDYDENGRPHTKSRLGAALSGGAVGYGAGRLAAPLIRAGANAGAGAAAVPHTAPPAAPAGSKEGPIFSDHLDIPQAAGAAAAPVAAAPAAEPGMMPAQGPMTRKTGIASFTLGIDMPFGKIAYPLPGGLDATPNRTATGPANAIGVIHKEGSKAVIKLPGEDKMGKDSNGMKKGPADAKAENTDHAKNVAAAKKEGMAAPEAALKPGFNPAIDMKMKGAPKPGFPNLNLKK